MSEASSAEEPLTPKKTSLLKSSMVMASGTLLSRILGFVRSAMLVAVVGVTGGVADAFNTANTLPNNVYNLLAAGVLDAVLVPQIIRALKRRGGSTYLNRLITLAGTILFGMTVLSMVCAPLLVDIMAASYNPTKRALAITFALFCLPQIFFYGVYNLLGEILNARGIFGPYMWAPVVNNVIGIAGLGTFLYIWGSGGRTVAAGSFTTEQIWLLAGSATLGVLLQALVLFIPLQGSGVKLRLDFHFRGNDFGSASKVAGWTFATLMVSQLGVISTSNLANAAGTESDSVASLASYSTAFMIYMVPQSLIAVTLATAIFTRITNNVTENKLAEVASDYHLGFRLITMLSMLCVAIIAVGAVPMMQMVMPNRVAEDASLYGSVLVALVLGIPSTGIVLISQRVFFAFEDARPVFLMGIVPTALQLIVGWSIFFLASPAWWTIGAAGAETVCRIVQGFIAIFWTARKVRQINAGKLVSSYLLYLGAAIISALGGWLVLHFLSPVVLVDSALGRFFGSFWRIVVVAIVVAVVFFAFLRAADPEGTAAAQRILTSKLPARFRRAEAAGADIGVEPEALTTQLALGPVLDQMEVEAADQVFEDEASPDSTAQLSRALGASDPSSTGELPMLGSTWNRAVPTFDEVLADSDTSGVTAGTNSVDSKMNLEVGMVKAVGETNQNTPRANGQNKFNPTIPALLIGVVILIIGIVFSVNALKGPSDSNLAEGLGLGSQSEEQSGQSAETEPPAEEQPAPPTAAPVIASTDIFSWNDDDGDHPELSSALVDGDPDSMWYSRYYDLNEFSPDGTIAILVKLKEPAKVTSVTLDVVGEGGQVAITTAQDGNPRNGTVLATASVSGNTVIKLSEPTDLSQLGINFVSLPTDDEGLARAKVTGVSVQ